MTRQRLSLAAILILITIVCTIGFVIAYEKPAERSLMLNDANTLTRLVTELNKEKIDFKIDENNIVRFTAATKKEVYRILNQILKESPKKPIGVSCDLDQMQAGI